MSQSTSGPGRYVVIGAGPVGRTVAEQLAEQGHPVRVLTRSGSGPEHPLVERIAADARGPELPGLLADATALFHCAHGSAYSASVWREELPATEAVVLSRAAEAGIPVVFPESLYSYAGSGTLREDDPRDLATGKGAVRRDLLRQRAASDAVTVSVVASDFIGPQVLAGGMLGERVMVPLLTRPGRRIRMLADLDQPHSFTYVPDLARTMIEASRRPGEVAAPGAPGLLHAPTAPARTQREMVALLAEAAGVPAPPLGSLSIPLLRAVGLLHGGTRELVEPAHSFARPYRIDSADAERRLGFGPTDQREQAATTVAWWRERLAAALPAAA